MVSKTGAVATMGIGLFFLLVAGVLIGVTGFLDTTDTDYMETAMTLSSISVIMIAIGLIVLVGGFAYVGLAAENNYTKIGSFLFAIVALYLLVQLLTKNLVSFGSILSSLGSMFGAMGAA